MAKNKALTKLTKTFNKTVIDKTQQLLKESGHKATKKNIKRLLKSSFGKNLIPHLVSECVKLYTKDKKTAMENFHHEIKRISKALAIQYLKFL